MLAHSKIVKNEILERVAENINFSIGNTKNTVIIPPIKAKIIRRLGSGWSLSSLSQNQSQRSAGKMPPRRENKIVEEESIDTK